MSEDDEGALPVPTQGMTAAEALAACRAEVARVRAQKAVRTRPDPVRERSPRQRPVADEVIFLRDELSLLVRQMAALAEHARHLQERLDVLTDPSRPPANSAQENATAGDVVAPGSSAEVPPHAENVAPVSSGDTSRT